MVRRRLTIRHLWPLIAVTLLVFANACRGEWFDFSPKGCRNGGGILGDVMSRCPQYGMGQIRGFDRATQAHEATHFVDGEISRKYGQDYCAFYVGEGKAFVVNPPPQVTIGQVARRVPQRIRNSRHRIYFASDRVGRNCLSLIDEWTCYTNDAQCTKELNLPYDGGLEAATDFATVADCVVATVKETDPQYDRTKLERFISFQKDRVKRLGGKL